MADAVGFLSGFMGGGSGGMSFGQIAMLIFFGTTVLVGVVGFGWWVMFKKKHWNLKVEFKLPRNDGRFINSEWGKGYYDSKRGVVFLKRKGLKVIAMEPFDVKKFLQGKDVLTVVQVGMEQYLPVLPDCFLQMVDEETGEEAAFMKLKVDLSKSKAWKSQFERDSKSAYTIMGLLSQYANFIGIGIILFMQLVGFAILYTKLAP